MRNIKQQIEEYQLYELSEGEQSKLQGEALNASIIEIKWKDRDFTDKGYLFQVPDCDEDIDMQDFLVHVPNPDNSDGMDDAPPIWVHLNSLLSNVRVKWVKCTGGIKN